MTEETRDPKHSAFWAETKFVSEVPHRGLDRSNWRARRAGRTLRVSMPLKRESLDERVREDATRTGCGCQQFWVMHPVDAASCELFAKVIYVCQAQIESD